MKTCGKCRESKSVDEFHKNKSKPDGLQGYCKACAKIRDAACFQKRKSAKYAVQAKRRREMLTWVRSQKKGPCCDCGQRFHPVAMGFDHLPEFEKSFDIADGPRLGYSRKRIAEEMKKCDLVCANCHAVRTLNRM